MKMLTLLGKLFMWVNLCLTPREGSALQMGKLRLRRRS